MRRKENRGLSPSQLNGDCPQRSRLKEIEAVVFDIDGVLIDSSRSFRKTIAQTTQFYFENILKYQGKETLVNQEDIQMLKDVGGFNNDWQLTQGLCLFYLCKSVLLASKDLAVLRYQEPFLDNYLVAGVKEFQGSVLELLDPNEQLIAKGLWNKSLIIQIFQELYAGKDYCKAYYGFDPVYFEGEGNINKEVSLLDNSLISTPVAVITGRSEAETKGALKLTGLGVTCDVVVCDNGRFETKPSAEALNYISDKMNIDVGLYVGDSMDDYLIVENFNKQDTNKRFLSAIVTKAPEKYKKTDIIARDVNEVLRLVKDA